MSAKGIYFRVSGDVQGVGYRAFAHRAAVENGITGWVRNRKDGAVEGEAFGEASGLQIFLKRLQEGPSRARVHGVSQRKIPVQDETDFEALY